MQISIQDLVYQTKLNCSSSKLSIGDKHFNKKASANHLYKISSTKQYSIAHPVNK